MLRMKCKLITYVLLYSQLLTEDPGRQLGAGHDVGAIRRHAFFESVDWEALQGRCMEPPFKPHLIQVSGTVSVLISCQKLLLLKLCVKGRK
jgi:hypothetical protein